METDAKIVRQLKDELISLLEEAVNKLIKENLSENLTKKIIGECSEPFLRDPNVAAVFKENLKNNRINYFRVALNPVVNNISYANNVVEMYENISKTWIEMLR